jgi:hypothetical protein
MSKPYAKLRARHGAIPKSLVLRVRVPLLAIGAILHEKRASTIASSAEAGEDLVLRLPKPSLLGWKVEQHCLEL